MQYLCLVYHDEDIFRRMSPDERAAVRRDAMAYDDALRRSGRLAIAHPLKRPHTARTVRIRARKRDIMDGPFAETKEQLIGFLVIEAGNMDEATELATAIPLARTGTVEIRGLSFHGDPELEEPAT